MNESQKNFKGPPKKYQPKGVSILYEDRDILVVDKFSGLLTIGTDRIKENTAHYILNDYVRKGIDKSKNRVFIVHRLDRDTSGVLVFAKSETAKSFLQGEWQNFSKKYYAVVLGSLEEKEGIISTYLTENKMHKMYSTKDSKKGKLARTGYRVLKESSKYSLMEVELLTGRRNQIRVHFADKGHPVAGDKMYGNRDRHIKRLTLHAASITILHPHTKEKMTFEAKIPEYFNTLMR
jgi:23S rRNA pseudouridine1911/1915/1917 synthase